MRKSWANDLGEAAVFSPDESGFVSEPAGLNLPDGTKMSFGERFQFVLRSLSAVEREKLGRSDKTLRGFTDESVPLEIVLALAAATGVTPAWIIFGDGQQPMAINEDFSLVQKLDIRASAGGGAIAPYEESNGGEVVAFRTDWLRRLGLNPRYARAIFAHGDSMEPTINSGDLLLVDESINTIVDHGIYVVVYQGMVVVKRVQLKRDGTLVLKSDNHRYETEEVPPSEIGQISVAGRVRWFGRTI